MAPGPSAPRRPLSPDPLGRAHAGQRGRRGRDGAAVRGRRELRVSRPRPARRITTSCAASSARPSARCSCERGCPTPSGHFGRFGGRFVPETLMAPLIELEQAYAAARARPQFQRRFAEPAGRLRRAARRRSTSPARLTEHVRRRAHLAQARGPLPHRRAQDQQRARPGPARQAHGQAAHHRRDRRRPARRGHRHGGARCSAGVRGLHGRGGRRAPGAQRLPHEAARRAGDPGGIGQPHAQGRHQRGAARLGHQRAHHVLPARLGAGPASVPDDGARLPVGDRPGGARARRGARIGRLPDVLVACVGGGSNAIGLFHPFIGDRAVRIVGVEPGGARDRERQARGHA